MFSLLTKEQKDKRFNNKREFDEFKTKQAVCQMYVVH